MNKAEQLAYDEHINAIMIQNDVLSTAAMEGRQEGLAEGRQEGLAEGRMEEKQANARRMKALNLPGRNHLPGDRIVRRRDRELVNSVFFVLFRLPLYSWGMC